MNKDEAVRCINIAKRSIVEGNKEKAEKFLNKSIALHDTNEARELLQSLSTCSPNGTARSSKPPDPAPDSSSSSSAETSRTKDCTPEMTAAVNKVKGKKDYYKILGCEKGATDAQLKKAYRKLALALHPDKNSAEGANEAFKAVGNAYAVLSNEEKRVRYDKYGMEDDGPSPRQRQGHRHYYNEEDITPEDLFNMFFGGMQPANRRHEARQFQSTYTTSQRNTGQENGNAFTSLIQMSPLLLLVLMSVLNSIFTEEPAWNYHRNGHYKIEKATAWNHIRYFVKGDFSEKYSGQKIIHLEYDIERDYKQELQIKCINNQRRKEQLMYQYRVSGNSRYRDYAESMDLQPCTDYNNFKLPQYINSPP